MGRCSTQIRNPVVCDASKGTCSLYIGSCMSALVLLNLFNELWKRDKMGGLLSILTIFRMELDKFNNAGARMLDSVYHMTFKLCKNHTFVVKHQDFVIFYVNFIMDVIT